MSINPLANRPRADACGFGNGLRRLSARDLPYNALSTARRQPGILMHVHPVLPWNLKLQQPQLPRSEPDGQPTESSQLAASNPPPGQCLSSCEGQAPAFYHGGPVAFVHELFFISGGWRYSTWGTANRPIPEYRRDGGRRVEFAICEIFLWREFPQKMGPMSQRLT